MIEIPLWTFYCRIQLGRIKPSGTLAEFVTDFNDTNQNSHRYNLALALANALTECEKNHLWTEIGWQTDGQGDGCIVG